MKLKVLLLALVCLFVAACLASPSDLDAKKKKKRTSTPIPSPTVQVTPMPTYLLAVNLTTATVPNFTPAAGDFIIPNSDTVSDNFVLQGDTTGGGTWVDIPESEWQLFPKRGKVAQRPVDAEDGATVDWGVYFAFRIHTYSKSVGGTRTSYSDQSVTFADETGLYSPIGVVGELNGEAIRDIVANFVVAAGGSTVIDDNGITIETGNSDFNELKWRDFANNFTYGEMFTSVNSGVNGAMAIRVLGSSAGSWGAVRLSAAGGGSGNHAAYIDAVGDDGNTNSFTKTYGGASYLGHKVGGGGAFSDLPLSFLDVAGSVGTAIDLKSANYSLTRANSTILVDSTSTQTLPSASTCTGRIYTVKKIDAGATVTVVDAGGANIDGAASDVITTLYDAHTYQSDGTQWWIIGK